MHDLVAVGTHTWSHKDLARNPYAKHLEQAEQEVEMGNSAVHMAAAGGKIAPFFRFPELQHLPQLLPYLAERNIAIFSADIDLRDFRMHKPDQVVKSVMSQLEKHGKGIILMHDLHRNTAEALPELIRQLKAGVGSKLWRMASRDRGGSGTRSLTRSGRRSSIWLLRSRICRRVSSPSTSRTRTAALCPRQAFIGS